MTKTKVSPVVGVMKSLEGIAGKLEAWRTNPPSGYRSDVTHVRRAERIVADLEQILKHCLREDEGTRL